MFMRNIAFYVINVSSFHKGPNLFQWNKPQVVLCSITKFTGVRLSGNNLMADFGVLHCFRGKGLAGKGTCYIDPDRGTQK